MNVLPQAEYCLDCIDDNEPSDWHASSAKLTAVCSCPPKAIDDREHPPQGFGSVALVTQWFPGLTIFIGIILIIMESALALPWLMFGSLVTVATIFVVVASRYSVNRLFGSD